MYRDKPVMYREPDYFAPRVRKMLASDLGPKVARQYRGQPEEREGLPPRKVIRGRNEPKRTMTADDLGLHLLRSPYDPVFSISGLLVPRLDDKKRRDYANRYTHLFITPDARAKARDERRAVRRFMRTSAGIAAKQEMRTLVARIVRAGEVTR